MATVEQSYSVAPRLQTDPLNDCFPLPASRLTFSACRVSCTTAGLPVDEFLLALFSSLPPRFQKIKRSAPAMTKLVDAVKRRTSHDVTCDLRLDKPRDAV